MNGRDSARAGLSRRAHACRRRSAPRSPLTSAFSHHVHSSNDALLDLARAWFDTIDHNTLLTVDEAGEVASHTTLGYATTIDAAQGITADICT